MQVFPLRASYCFQLHAAWFQKVFCSYTLLNFFYICFSLSFNIIKLTNEQSDEEVPRVRSRGVPRVGALSPESGSCHPPHTQKFPESCHSRVFTVVSLHRPTWFITDVSTPLPGGGGTEGGGKLQASNHALVFLATSPPSWSYLEAGQEASH